MYVSTSSVLRPCNCSNIEANPSLKWGDCDHKHYVPSSPTSFPWQITLNLGVHWNGIPLCFAHFQLLSDQEINICSAHAPSCLCKLLQTVLTPQQGILLLCPVLLCPAADATPLPSSLGSAQMGLEWYSFLCPSRAQMFVRRVAREHKLVLSSTQHWESRSRRMCSWGCRTRDSQPCTFSVASMWKVQHM